MTRYLIVGSGVFGLSTAYHLLLSGEKQVTVIDKAPTLPAPDGSSVDINRIVRTAYGNSLYTNLTKEAIDLWKRDFPGVYHESGVLIIGESGYAREAQTNDVAAGLPTKPFLPESTFPPRVPIGDIRNAPGYITVRGGWADAEGGIKALLQKVADLGGQVIPGVTVESLLFGTNNEITGVSAQDGTIFTADVVVLATGSWTPSTFHQVCPDLAQRLTATGQSVACVQLTPEEAEQYQGVPVVFDLDTGYYVFPPNRDNLVKSAIHDGGYLNTAESEISRPRTLLSHGEVGLSIPKAMADKLRDGLRRAYPELADKPFCKTRLCWYADTEDGDWIIDEHPNHKNLFIATGGSGHAYKFLPVLGRLVLERINGNLSAEASATFSFTRSFAPHVDPDRIGRRTQLFPADASELVIGTGTRK